MLLFSSAPCCHVLVIGTNSNRKNGKENNPKIGSARGILAQHKDLISVRSAQGKEILHQGIDPWLKSASLGCCLMGRGWTVGHGLQTLPLPPTPYSEPLPSSLVNSHRLFAGIHFAGTLPSKHAVSELIQ